MTTTDTTPDPDLCPSCGMGVVDDPHYTATGVAWHGECMLAWGTTLASTLGPHVAPLLGEQAADVDQRWHHLHQRATELDAERTLNAGQLADAQAELEQARFDLQRSRDVVDTLWESLLAMGDGYERARARVSELEQPPSDTEIRELVAGLDGTARAVAARLGAEVLRLRAAAGWAKDALEADRG